MVELDIVDKDNLDESHDLFEYRLDGYLEACGITRSYMLDHDYLWIITTDDIGFSQKRDIYKVNYVYRGIMRYFRGVYNESSSQNKMS